jgi:hypothetical protein
MSEPNTGSAPKKWAVEWDNGHSCGTFPERYATEEEAEQAAEFWYTEMVAEDPEGADDYSAEAIQIDRSDSEK